MMKTKSTKRALLMSALSLLLCVSMLVGSTFAWFTDSVTSGKNTIQSGNLDVKLEYSVQKDGVWTAYEEVDSETDIFGYNNWEPGYTAIAKFRVTNVGSLALKYQLTADVYEEIPGVNVAGKEFLLSDYLYTEVVDADATREEILASTTGKRLKAPERSDVPLTDLVVSARALEKNQSEEVALAIWMPTTVGNEANHNGTNQPAISFGINLLATQQTSEKDSFNNQYDVNATYPALAWASKPIDPAASFVALDLLRANGSKAGFAEFPVAALDTAAENVTVKVVETKTYANLTIEDDQTAVTYEVTAEGVKAGNTTPIKVSLTVGAGKTGVKLYHYGNEITDAVYDANDGTIVFYTTSFSPFSVVYDAVAVEENEEDLNTTVPKATVTDADEFENVALGWTGWGGFNPVAGAAQQLNSVYLFEAPHDSTTVQDCAYKDWGCDYFVMLESDNLSVLPEGSITLGGNYGGYGWVGFDNPTVNTNEWIPLLGSVMGDGESGWTYADVVGLVKQFWCGVGVANGNANGSIADLSDAKFVVELRLTNPEDPTDVKTTNRVTYTFANGNSSISDVVNSGDELQDAVNNGSGDIVLGGDIDLSQGIVIPGN